MNKNLKIHKGCHADPQASKVKQLQFRGKSGLWYEAIDIKQATWTFFRLRRNFKEVSCKAQLCAKIPGGGGVGRVETNIQKGQECPTEILKRAPKSYQDPVL